MTGGTQEPEQSSTTAQSTFTTDALSSTESPIIANSPSGKEEEEEEVPPKSSISGQNESSTPAHSADLTTGTPVSTEATTSSGHESSEKSTITSESGTSAIPIEMKVGPEDGESGSTSSSSPKLGSSGDITSQPLAGIPASLDEKKKSELPTTTPDFESDGTESEFVYLNLIERVSNCYDDDSYNGEPGGKSSGGEHADAGLPAAQG